MWVFCSVCDIFYNIQIATESSHQPFIETQIRYFYCHRRLLSDNDKE
jgi:hypothetical protein